MFLLLSPLTSDCFHWCFWSVDPVHCAHPISEARLQWCEAISILISTTINVFVNVSFEVAYKPKHHRNLKYNTLFLQHLFTLLADTYPNYTV